MDRPINKKMFLWLIVLLAVSLLAACSPNMSGLSDELTEGEAPAAVTSSSKADLTEEPIPSHTETAAETAEATETEAETTEKTSEDTKQTAEETTAEISETTTKATAAPPTPTPEPTPVVMAVSLAIKCHIATAAGLAGAPADGIILEAVTVDLGEGESVFDVLIRVGRAKGIAVASIGSGANAFVTGIAGLTAVDRKSGWVYSVNGTFANIGSGSYKLGPGDIIEWHYTMDTGNDLK